MVSAIGTKVLAIRIHVGGLGTDRSLAEQVQPVCFAVTSRAFMSAQGAEFDRGAVAIPNEGELGAVGDQARRPGCPADTVQPKRVAIRTWPTQCAEVGDGVMRLRDCQ